MKLLYKLLALFYRQQHCLVVYSFATKNSSGYGNRIYQYTGQFSYGSAIRDISMLNNAETVVVLNVLRLSKYQIKELEKYEAELAKKKPQ